MSVTTRSVLPLVLVAALALGACENMTKKEQKILSGGAIGAAAGATITAVTGGCVACGAAVGGAVGAGAGYVIDQWDK